MRWFLKSLWTPRMRVGWLIFSLMFILVSFLDAAYAERQLARLVGSKFAGLADGVVVELNGALVDLFLVGVVLLWFDERRERIQRERNEALDRKADWEAQLSDFRGWDSDESAKRTAGIVRRLIAAGERVRAPEANLAFVDLTDVNFVAGANLEGANLTAARFANSNLREANLRRASLKQANFRGARLDGAILEQANLSEANLAGARLDGATLEQADLSAADLAGAQLDRANLKGARLDGANFRGTRLDGADLEGASRSVEDPPVPGWVRGDDGALKRADGVDAVEPSSR